MSHRSGSPKSSHGRLVSTIFCISGAAGLIYQVVWTHDLVLLFGDTTEGIVTTVSAFLAGLGAGAGIAGALVPRLRRPIRLYVLIELLIGALALPMPLVFNLIAVLLRGAYLTLSAPEVAFIRFALAFLALAPVTILMGATLPVLTRHIVRTSSDVGPWIGRLYSVNTAGAVLGTLASGLLLIELVGLEATTLVAVACNLTAAAGASIVAREHKGNQAIVPVPARTQSGLNRSQRSLLLLTFVSGFVSLSLEILWNRTLTQETGGIIYYFVVILAVFLLGIAGGSRAFQHWTYPISFALLGICLAAVGPLAILPVLLSNILGPAHFQGVVILLIFPTALLGFTFPLTARLFVRDTGRAASGLGFLYASNTAGCVIGTVVSGFVLIPTIGTNLAVVGVSLVLATAGCGAVVGTARRRIVTLLPSSLLVLCLLTLLNVPAVRFTYTQRTLQALGAVTRHYEDVIATVDTVSSPTPAKRQLLINGVGITNLTVDTKLLVYLPYIARPSSRSILIVCFGMGSSYRTAILLGLHTQAVELDPTVPSVMSVYFSDAKKILANRLGSIRIDDGLSYMELTSKHYNIIVTDAPPPSDSAGALELLTEQYYTDARSRLTPGGVMSVFIPFGTSSCDLRVEIRAFAAVFPHTEVFVSLGGNGVQLIGSMKAISFPAASVERVLGSPTVAADLRLAPDSPVVSAIQWPAIIRSNLWLTGAGVQKYLGPGPLLTEDHPISEYYLFQASLLKGCEPVSYSGKAAAPLYRQRAPFPPQP